MLYLEVSGGENQQAALDYLRHYNSPHMLGIDVDYSMMKNYESMGWPRHVIIDASGVVRFHGFGENEKLGNIRRVLDGLLAQKAEIHPAPVVRDQIAYTSAAAAARDARRERSPRLALDLQGRPWVVYTANPGGQNDIYVRPPDGSATVLASNPADDYAPDCVFDSSGRLWVAWCSNRGANGNYDIYVQRHGDTAEPLRLSVSAEDAMRPRLAAAPDGRLAVAYYKWSSMRGVSRDRDIFARLYDPQANGWGREFRVSPPQPAVEDHTDPDVAFGPDGKALVVWSYDYHPSLYKTPLDTSEPSVFGALITAREAGPARLAGSLGARQGIIDLFPSVARDGAGALWCAWDAGNDRIGRTIRLARWDGQGFEPKGNLADKAGNATTPELGPAGDGILAAWTEREGANWHGCFAEVKDGVVKRKTNVEAAAGDVLFPQAILASDGKIWAVWEECGERESRAMLREITLK